MYTLGTGFTSGSTYTDNFCLPWVPGCTDPGASNYDPLANADDGSCLYGCIASDTTESWETYGGGFGTTWSNDPTNTLDWTVRTGGTPSFNQDLLVHMMVYTMFIQKHLVVDLIPMQE